MPSQYTDRQRPSRPHGQAAADGTPPPHLPPPEQQEQLPCPRCDSTNTKFCYYNNYNFSQPRHFCKSCRRYWTRGGTLRDIPVGGGTRRNSKRSRASTSSSAAGGNSASPALTLVDGSASIFHGTVQSSGAAGDPLKPVSGSFTSLLTTTQGPPGFLALGGLGLGLEDMAYGIGRAGTTWDFPGVAEPDSGVAVNESDHAGGAFGMGGAGGGTWQLESGVDGGGDCFSWPELAISTPGNGA